MLLPTMPSYRDGLAKQRMPARFGRPYALDPVPLRDAFTGGNGVLLTAHPMDVGGPWAKHPASGVANPVLQSGRAWAGSGGGSIFMIAAPAPSSADYDVSADFDLITDNDSSVAGVIARYDTTANTGISAHYNSTDNAFKLFETVAGVNGPVTTIASALSGQRVTLRVRGARAALLVNGAEIAAITTTVLATGRAGVRFSGTSTSTTGVQLDDFAMTEAGPLRWAPPDTTGWPVVHLSNASRTTAGDGTTSVVIVIDEPITATGGLSISNYKDVVLIGGEIDFSASATGRTASQMRGIDFFTITGQVYIEGVLVKGAPHSGAGNAVPVAGGLGDAFNFHSVFGGLTSRALITMQNVRVEHARVDCLDQQTGTGAYAANEVHSDLIQIYSGGPQFGLRVDKFSGQTSYQGFFTQSGTRSPMDLSRVNIDGTSEAYVTGTPVSAYLLSSSSDNTRPHRIATSEVYLKAPDGKSASAFVSHAASGSTIGPNPGRRGQIFTWTDGTPPLGDWVPAGVAGMNYVSPGYQES